MKEEKFLKVKRVYYKLMEARDKKNHIDKIKEGEGSLVVEVTAYREKNGRKYGYISSKSFRGTEAQILFEKLEEEVNLDVDRFTLEMEAE
jgi:hypothetical protein